MRATPAFLRAVVELSTCETVDVLIDAAFALLGRELGVRGRIELWDGDNMRVTRGEPVYEGTVHRTWIGIEYTLGMIELSAPPADPDDIELLAQQLAPLAERLMEREASQRRTIREDVDRLYERRIRDALVRRDWNFSAVARELVVSRGRVAEIARRWRTPPPSLLRSGTARVMTSTTIPKPSPNPALTPPNGATRGAVTTLLLRG